jgi:3-oxocholest-4-en-26-oate---CoA ligase
VPIRSGTINLLFSLNNCAQAEPRRRFGRGVRGEIHQVLGATGSARLAIRNGRARRRRRPCTVDPVRIEGAFARSAGMNNQQGVGMDFHFATAFELIADTVPNEPALSCGDVTRSWAEFDDRSARVAGVLNAHGLAPGAKVGIYLHNSNEYSEVHHGVFKMRGCPINVNYRYKADELVYLLDNADAEAVVYQSTYAMRIWEIREKLPKVKLWLQVDDSTESLLHGALDYERALRTAAPAPRIARPGDDVYMLYTGGTTGMPKGVMYYNGEFCRGLCAGGFGMAGLPGPTSVDEIPDLVRQAQTMNALPRSLAACPQMHGTGMWLGTLLPMLCGGSTVTISRLGFDPDVLFAEVEKRRVTDITIVGDAFARPMVGALDAAHDRGHPYDLSSVKHVISSGVMWSAEVKQGLLKHHDMVLMDTMGSTEGGMASAVSTRAAGAQTAKFQLSEGVRVFTDDGRIVQPGSNETGKIGLSGSVPIGYYKDPKKSAETFRVIDGVRYSFPGDYARVEADGTITLLGRGSNCINTAGEKVYPEEVEEVVKRHAAIYDCLVVGVPDERFGERVVAVASLREGASADPTDLIEYTREHLAAFKAPRQMIVVDEVRRAPNGKADYKWAKATALAELRSA